MIHGLKKTKYMVINTGMEPEEVIEERVKEGLVQETDNVQVPRNDNQQIRKLERSYTVELNIKCEVINRDISAISTKHQVGKEEIRVKLKLYKSCLM